MLTPFSERMRWRVIAEQELMKLRLRLTAKKVDEPFYLLAEDLTQINVTRFIKASVNGDLSAIVIYLDESEEGEEPYEIPEEKIALAWLNLVDQYQDAVKSEKSEHLIDVSRQITKITLRLNTVEWLCSTIELSYKQPTPQSQKIIDKASEELTGYGYRYAFTADTYERHIERIRTGEKRHESIKNRLESKLKDDKSEGKQKATAEDFYKVIATLRKHHGYNDSPYILADKWTMADYCLELTRYNKDVEEENKRIALQKAKQKYGTTQG